VKDKINEPGATLVDVRTVEEFEIGHVENTINIPMDQVPGRLDEFKEMSKPLVVFCQSGNRSGQVANFLVNQGLLEVYNGGGWVEVRDMLK
jgi:phage shock protein E